MKKLLPIFSVAICCISYFIFSNRATDKIFLSVVLLLALCLVVSFFKLQQSSDFKGFWLKPSNLMVLGLMIVNFQYLVDIVIEYKPIGSYPLEFGNTINVCAIIALMGLAAFILGYHIDMSKKQDNVNVQENFRYTSIPIIILEVVFLVLWIQNVSLIRFFNGESYLDDEGGSVAEYCEAILSAAIFAQAILASYSTSKLTLWQYIKQIPIISILVILCYIALRFVSGDRGPVIYTVLIFMYSYFKASQVKIRLLYCVVAISLASILASLVGMARMDMADGFSGGLYSAVNSYSEEGRFGRKTVINSTEELANSFLCNEIAVNEIQNLNKSYNYGGYQLSYILNTIPYMPSFLRHTLKIDQDRLSSSSYITTSYLGKDPTYGLGTTCIADFYLDMGLIGVFLGMFLTGLLFHRVDRFICFSQTQSLLVSVIMFGYASKAIYIPRSALLMQLQWLLMILIIIIVCKKLKRR